MLTFAPEFIIPSGFLFFLEQGPLIGEQTVSTSLSPDKNVPCFESGPRESTYLVCSWNGEWSSKSQSADPDPSGRFCKDVTARKILRESSRRDVEDRQRFQLTRPSWQQSCRAAFFLSAI